jgi:hypothetical protein
MNCSVKGKSGLVSLSPVKLMLKRPKVVAQRDASTDRSAVQIRCCARISEKRTSLNARVGLHKVWPRDCVMLKSRTIPANGIETRDRCIGGFPSIEVIVARQQQATQAGIHEEFSGKTALSSPGWLRSWLDT